MEICWCFSLSNQIDFDLIQLMQMIFHIWTYWVHRNQHYMIENINLNDVQWTLSIIIAELLGGWKLLHFILPLHCQSTLDMYNVHTLYIIQGHCIRRAILYRTRTLYSVYTMYFLIIHNPLDISRTLKSSSFY